MDIERIFLFFVFQDKASNSYFVCCFRQGYCIVPPREGYIEGYIDTRIYS